MEKFKEVRTLEQLGNAIEEYYTENSDGDCWREVEGVCVRNRWRYCGNYPGYLDEDIADDGKDILYIHESGLVNRPSVIM